MRGMRLLKGLAVTALAAVTLPAQGKTVKYYHLDAVGSVRVVTDAGGGVVERHDYLPFGEECTAGGCASNPALGAGEPRKYTGKERDRETGLDYFGARYYAAKTGRFTAIDPVYTWKENLLDPQRWNRYAYVRNNPLKYTDPDGRLLDIIADAGFIAYDLIDIGVTRFTGGEVSGTQKLALSADIAAAAIPFVTGAGIAIRGAERAEHAVEAGRAAEHIVQAERAEAKGGTYILRDAEGGVARTGRTNDLGRRAGEHGRRPDTADLKFEVDRRTDVYAQQRGREQVIHDTHKPPLNKVNPISPTNPRRQDYLDAAKKLENR